MDAVADRNGRRRKTLGRAQGICPHLLDSGDGIGEDGETATCSLEALDPKLCLADGENLSIRDVLVSAEVEAAPGPATQ